MSDIQPGVYVLVPAKVDMVITLPDGRERVKVTVDDWVDAERVQVVGK